MTRMPPRGGVSYWKEALRQTLELLEALTWTRKQMSGWVSK